MKSFIVYDRSSGRVDYPGQCPKPSLPALRRKLPGNQALIVIEDGFPAIDGSWKIDVAAAAGRRSASFAEVTTAAEQDIDTAAWRAGELAMLKGQALNRLDAENATLIEMAHRVKWAEAQAIVGDPDVDHSQVPLLAAEAAADGVALREKAAEVLAAALGDREQMIGDELRRIALKRAIRAARTPKQINNVLKG